MEGLDLASATITELSGLIEKKVLSPVELTKATIERIEKLDPKLKAFTTATPDYALEQAKKAEQEIMAGGYRGPMHGIPYTLKDVIATAGIRTTFGNPRLVDFKPAEHATVHNLLEAAGGILVGKVYSQIGRSGGPVECYNPWDLTKSPGTSSSGSGSATAASLGWLSLGTDTGGSVRHPASNCGLVGMKATFGRISRFGVVAPSWNADQAGPITRTVEDNAIAMGILGVFDPKDIVSINEPAEDFRGALRQGIAGMKVGIPTDAWVWEKVAEEDEEIVRTAIALLGDLGAEVIEIAMPKAYDCRAVNQSLGAQGGSVWWRDHFSEEQLEAWPEIYPRIVEGAKQPFREFQHAQYQQAEIRQEMIANFKKVDVIAFPTGSTLGDTPDKFTTILRGQEVPTFSRAVWLNGLASLTGIPALSVPCGFANGGTLPVGLMLHGMPLSESLLYRLAYAYEQATDWHKWTPPMS